MPLAAAAGELLFVAAGRPLQQLVIHMVVLLTLLRITDRSCCTFMGGQCRPEARPCGSVQFAGLQDAVLAIASLRRVVSFALTPRCRAAVLGQVPTTALHL
jgi:hypothetical protein